MCDEGEAKYHESMYRNGKLLSMAELSQILEQNEIELALQEQVLSRKKADLQKKTEDIQRLQSRLEQLEGVINAKRKSEMKLNIKNPAAVRMGICGDVNNEKMELPNIMKSRGTRDLIKSAFSSKNFLTHLSNDLLDSLIDCMDSKVFMPDEHLTKEGEKGDCFFVIESGTCVILKEDPLWNNKVIGEGVLIAELAILYNCSRTATIKAVTTVSAWFLKRNVYQIFMREHNEKCRIINSQFLRSIPLFQKLEESNMMKIVDVLHQVSYIDKDVIVRQGEKGDKFYIIKKGKVIVTKTNDDMKEEVVANLYEGNTFGEKALLSTDIRTATVTAVGVVICLVLNSETFKFLIGELGDDSSRIYLESKISEPQASTSMKSKTNFKLEDFTFVKILGGGAFGKVELVLCEVDNRKYALKSMLKAALVKYNQMEHIRNERDILFAADCPFIYQLYQTFRDKKNLYLLVELFTKPDIFRILRTCNTFDENTAKFCAACVIEALCYLHNMNVIYRDLKPENLTVDDEGYVKLIDMGFAKFVSPGKKTYTFCGTTEYIAPEIFLSKGHDKTADLWGLGILIFEFLAGYTPFLAEDQDRIMEKVQKGIEIVHFPRKIQTNALILVKGLCRSEPSLRLGNGAAGYKEIRESCWYKGFDWASLQARNMPAPVFDVDFEAMEQIPVELQGEDFEEDECLEANWDIDF